jgi:hypothetical protein
MRRNPEAAGMAAQRTSAQPTTRAPFVPGEPSALATPLRALREPAAYFDEAALIAACRRTSALADRWTLRLIMVGLLFFALRCLA